ncbi:MAG: LacI family DNA-binding transcriptional regulator, partial [Rubrivivax sp.]|nr:LacI family DNA-binding transcriptional regulator [Rubrivivax sp.]
MHSLCAGDGSVKMGEGGTGQGKGRRSARSGGRVTLDMVAEAAGVSAASVSRILNGTAIVSGEKRAAVDEAIARLGYVPNPVARGLAGGRTLSIGVVTQAIDSPFYGGALRGIEDTVSAAGYSPLFVSGQWSAAHESRCIDTLRSRRVDGVIVLTGRMADAALAAVALELPVVVTGRTMKAPGLVALDFDNFEGARLATHHLLSLGHRRIAFISGDLKHPDGKERLRGYRAALKAAGLGYEPALVMPGNFTEASGLTAVERLIDSREAFTA